MTHLHLDHTGGARDDMQAHIRALIDQGMDPGQEVRDHLLNLEAVFFEGLEVYEGQQRRKDALEAELRELEVRCILSGKCIRSGC